MREVAKIDFDGAGKPSRIHTDLGDPIPAEIVRDVRLSYTTEFGGAYILTAIVIDPDSGDEDELFLEHIATFPDGDGAEACEALRKIAVAFRFK